MDYSVVSHFSGSSAQPRLDLTARLPWLYIITAPSARVLYIGETFDPGGLVVRLGSHFGPYPTSTLRRRSAEIAGQNPLASPFLVVAARLPHIDDDAPFDGSSKRARLLCEALLHEFISIRFVQHRTGWAIVSTPMPSELERAPAIVSACDAIYRGFEHSVLFLQGLVARSTFHLVLMDVRNEPAQPAADVGTLLTQIELRLHSWLVAELKTAHGAEWWTLGIPTATRIECGKRQEEEGMRERIPPDAYLNLIDLRAIAQKNWQLCGKTLERVSKENGKERGTNWFVELNEVRKLWAHPLKQLYQPLEPHRVAALRELHARVMAEIPMAPTSENLDRDQGLLRVPNSCGSATAPKPFGAAGLGRWRILWTEEPLYASGSRAPLHANRAA